MERFDAIVVGAGPAGSTAAFRLSCAGARVLLVDRERFPRDKPCGGGMTMRAVRQCPVDPTPVVEELVDRVELRFRYGAAVVHSANEPVVWMTQRCRLDAFLQGYDVKFLEFNADSPAGIGYTDVLHEGLRRSIDLPRVNAEFETSYTPMLPVLIETLLGAYRELRGERSDLPETPRLALVDVAGSPSVPEFRIIC